LKKLLFGMAFFIGAMMFSTVNVQAEELVLRWRNLTCSDGSGGTHEICWASGNGDICTTYGEKTRNCDPWTDPE